MSAKDILQTPDAEGIFAELDKQRGLAINAMIDTMRSGTASLEQIRYRAGMLDGIILSINALRELRGT